MALHITKASDPILVERLVLCIYGGPGLGKTSLAFTADRPLLLDFDRGVYRAINRGDAVQVSSWEEVARMTDPDLAGYDTAVIDTAGRALDDLSATLIADDPKNANRSGGLSLPGYGALKTTFAAWLKRLTSSGLDVVLLAHMDEQRKGDDVIERLDIQGGTKNEIYKSADAMGRLYMENGQRRLAFSPSDVAHGKNPGRLETLEVPSFEGGQNPTFLGDVIRRIKATLNEETEVVRRGRELLEAKRLEFAKLTTADTFTAEAVALAGAGASPAVKRLLVQIARERGFRFDAEGHGFVVMEAPAEAPSAPRVELPPKATRTTARKAAADA